MLAFVNRRLEKKSKIYLYIYSFIALFIYFLIEKGPGGLYESNPLAQRSAGLYDSFSCQRFDRVITFAISLQDLDQRANLTDR